MEQDPQDQKKSVDEAGEVVGKLLGGAVVFAVLWFGFDAFIKYEAENTMDEIHNQVADDFERQYRDVQKYGTAMDKCIRAGMVAEGHLQAGNQSSYAQWKAIERADCRAAGLNR